MSDFTLVETHRDFQPGNTKVRMSVTGPTSYEAGGSPADVNAAADPAVDLAYGMEVTRQPAGYAAEFVAGTTPDYNAANMKILMRNISDGAEVTATTNLESVLFEIEVRVGMTSS
jgi:hypothetical protein